MSYDTSYVDGVPVKISEKYRAPRKVSLLSFSNYQVNTEALTTEYDVTLEKETLKWLENLKHYKDNRKVIRAEKIRQYEEEKQNKLLEEQKKEEEKRLHEEMEKQNEEEKRLQEEIENENKENDDIELEDKESDNSSEQNSNGNGSNCYQDHENQHCSNSEVPQTISSAETKEMVDDKPELKGEEINQTVNEPASKISDNKDKINQSEININSNTMYFHSHISSHSSHPNSYQTNGSSVLVPTQCPSSTSKEAKTSLQTSNINFAEFEGDASDPFDSVALKSINDMEELAKVLQTQDISQNKQNIYQQPISYQNPYPATNHYISKNAFPYSNNYNNSQQNQPSAHSSTISSPSNPVPSASNFSGPQYPYNYSQNNWNNNSSQSGVTPERPNMQPYSSYSQVNSSNISQANDTAYGASTTYPNVLPSSVVSNNVGFDPSINMVNKRQDLEDFYSRYYSNKRSTNSAARSGDSTPITNLQTQTLSSSVPDLTALEDSEVQNIVERRPSRDFNYPVTNTSRPSSTNGYEVPYRNDGKGSGTPTRSRSRFRLSDPFVELTEDAQNLVQSMAEMGFPRPRVARAVQKLGTDHKKLLEVLLTLQSFEDNGENEYTSERAFYFYMGDMRKVHECLDSSKELQKLGFDEDRTLELLLKHGNDKDKCLEELIG